MLYVAAAFMLNKGVIFI